MGGFEEELLLDEFVNVSGGRKLCLDKLVTFQEILDFYRNMW